MSLSHTAGLLCPSLDSIFAEEGLFNFFLSIWIKMPPPNPHRLQLTPAGNRHWLVREGLVRGLERGSHQELPAPCRGTQPQRATQPRSSRTPGPGGLPVAQRGCQRANPSLHTRGPGMPRRVWAPNASTKPLRRRQAEVPLGPQAWMLGTQDFAHRPLRWIRVLSLLRCSPTTRSTR